MINKSIVANIVNKLVPSSRKQIKNLTGRLEIIEQQQVELQNDCEKIIKQLQKIQDICERNKKSIENDIQISKKVSRSTDEIVWGGVFNNAISESLWLGNKTFFPGRWAVGYQYLYVLYRALNDVKPIHILDLGLGQTTNMISQYTAANENVMHRIVEHDKDWVKFYMKEHLLPDSSQIIEMELGEEVLLDDSEVLVFKYFKNKLADIKYDLISVDAPFGGKANIYARIDILKLIPDQLEDSFVIMFDDAQRKGEHNTIQVIKKTLEENNIEYSSGVYGGNKDVFVITSMDYKFLCTL